MTALPLPKFTFLCGPNTPAKYELCKLITSLDDTLWWTDIESTLREATIALFFGGDLLGVNLTLPEELSKKLPGFDISVEAWLAAFRTGLENNVDPAAVGRIALQQYKTEGYSDIYDRFLWRDVDNLNDTVPFLAEFGADPILYIHVGPLRVEPGSKGNIWLPHPSPEKNLEHLRHELQGKAVP